MYVLRFFFEWGGGCLWPGNDAAYREFGYGPLDMTEVLPLSLETVTKCRKLGEWYDTSLNWDYPPDPGPWRQAECDQFNTAAAELLADLRKELGPQFEVIDRQVAVREDPELDAYLANPKAFRRTHP
jgi:hypothetical protein